MTDPFFPLADPVAYQGPDSRDPLAFRWYDADRVVAGRTMRDHLRFAACYWHSFTWQGNDQFGAASLDRPWFGGDMDAARRKADVAFEMFRLLGVPFFTFHDRDIAPEGASLADSSRNVNEIADIFARRMEETGVGLLWGTANLFSHPRYMGGAATNPDPEVFVYAAAQVKTALEVTHRLGGENYVLWGGREGYETLLNTDLEQELEQYGRFLTMVADHKEKIGFKGPLLIEPKPQEPTKHQYDYDVASIYGVLQRFGLEEVFRINIEQNHALLAGHSFEHEIALAASLGLLGSLDMNRGDYQCGWDTDQFAMNIPELTLALHEVLKAGGIAPGGMNFDAKIRRQSLDPEDLLIGHVASMDAIARALLAADAMLEDGTLADAVDDRYAGWADDLGQSILAGDLSLEDAARLVADCGLDPQPRSGRQEYLESLVNHYV